MAVKPPTKELVKLELDRIKVELEKTRPQMRDLKEKISGAKAIGQPDLALQYAKELDGIEKSRIALKSDLYFLLAVEKELNETQV